MARLRQQIGPYSVGEIPQPLQIAFLDADGAPVDLAGMTADFVIERVDGEAVATDVGAGAATVEDPASAGVTQYAFGEADCAAAGRYRGQMWVGDGDAVRLASIEYWWDVVAVTAAPDV
jgi:hypothetical protein